MTIHKRALQREKGNSMTGGMHMPGVSVFFSGESPGFRQTRATDEGTMMIRFLDAGDNARNALARLGKM